MRHSANFQKSRQKLQCHSEQLVPILFCIKMKKRKKREEENKKETQMSWILIILRGKRSSKVHLKHEFGKKNLGERKGFLFSRQLYCPVSMYL